ncbi:YdcH family protein [Thalassococcus sp. CAU 1522]|uniref:YdcH family protein n=1 Tax=Thalassococcus arenae TaxID=2851652 RepID=A0ABS6NBC0_9RHOB|nr:YdcH family protein [Thalassococcus arenae]MBV2361309.1 YdcH family protein [Thalassococcus arenae]
MTRQFTPPASIEARIDALRSRHGDLDARIRSEQLRPLPNAAHLRHLKSRKLKLKDEMTYYEGVLRTLAGMEAPHARDLRA